MMCRLALLGYQEVAAPQGPEIEYHEFHEGAAQMATASLMAKSKSREQTHSLPSSRKIRNPEHFHKSSSRTIHTAISTDNLSLGTRKLIALLHLPPRSQNHFIPPSL
jgi:hypothetical protein